MEPIMAWAGDISDEAKTAALFAVIIAITWIAARFAHRFVLRLNRSDKNPLPESSIFANIARIAVWALGVATAFKTCLGIDVSALIAALGIGGIAISLGFQDTLSNLIGGLQVSLAKLVEPGDTVEVLAQKGTVVDVSWRHTTIRDVDGNIHLVPNALMNKSSIMKVGERLTQRIEFILPFGTDLAAFREAACSLGKEELAELACDDGVDVVFEGTVVGGWRAFVVVTYLLGTTTPDVLRTRVTQALSERFAFVEAE